jgi:hypothetical protein
MWIYYLILIVLLIAGGIYFWHDIRPDIKMRRNLSLT